MGTFGCHSCGVKLEELKDKPYEQWPCATCALSKNYTKTFSTGFFDTGEDDEDGLPDEHGFEYGHEFITDTHYPLNEEETRTLETIQQAVERQIYASFSGLMVRMLQLAKANPIMFEVIIKKLQFPYMSYSEIGDTMQPKCSKQNVLYHLKSAVKQFPELGNVIAIDTRYSGGRYALRTLAEKRRKEMVETRVQQALYGPRYFTGRYPDVKELNAILRSPLNVRDEVFTYNAYVKDEDALDEPSGSESGQRGVSAEGPEGGQAPDGEAVG